ncbi:MAG TPA: hypothetical protein PKW35_00190, partial [Nannocystaceae bacterium]|nr:hypothetical protein [Nannocystaceae bacterium]
AESVRARKYFQPDRGTQGRQRELAALLVETLDEPDWGLTPEAVAALSTRARVRGDVGIALADRLDDIRRAEQLVAPAAVLFEYVLGCHDQTPTEIAEGIRAHWGHALRSTIDLDALITIETSFRGWGDADSGRRWIRLAAALHNAAYEDAIYLLLAQNEVVMKARSSGAAWATVRDGKLQVRFRDATPAHLPTAEVLPSYWRHSYFIGSLRSITRGVTQ